MTERFKSFFAIRGTRVQTFFRRAIILMQLWLCIALSAQSIHLEEADPFVNSPSQSVGQTGGGTGPGDDVPPPPPPPPPPQTLGDSG